MDKPFSIVLASAFYDGPEEGVAIRPDGAAAAFWSLADSPFGMFRAFYFRPIFDPGAVQNLVRSAPDEGAPLVLLGPEADEALKACVATAGPVNQIAVGSSYLDWLRFAPATTVDVETMLISQTEVGKYRRAHAHLKRQGMARA